MHDDYKNALFEQIKSKNYEEVSISSSSHHSGMTEIVMLKFSNFMIYVSKNEYEDLETGNYNLENVLESIVFFDLSVKYGNSVDVVSNDDDLYKLVNDLFNF